jgi:SAM-dependent methyltransferase
VIGKLLRRQTLASFDFQWRELPEGGALLSDEWFVDNATRIVTDELLCLKPEWFAGRRVLDAGCGAGRWTVALLRLGCHVVATDFSDAALGYTRDNVAALCSEEQAARLETIRADLLSPPAELTRDRFDLVFSFGVLHHTGDTRAALGNVARLVDDGGVVFLYLYGKASVSPVQRLLLTAERLALAPLPFRLKKRVVALVRRGADVHQSFDLLSPTINTRHTFGEVERWLHELGFPDVTATIPHSELFVRGLREPEALAPYVVPSPSPPYWFERYG